MKSEGKSGTVAESWRRKSGAGGALNKRHCQAASGAFSAFNQGCFCSRSFSCWNPLRTFTQSEHGCLPLNVLETAVPRESWRVKSAIIRPHATVCSASQCPPLIAKMAARHAMKPVTLRTLLIPLRRYMHNLG